MTTPQNIEQLIAEAKAAYEAEEYSQAITGFEAAEQALKANGDLLNAAEMANNRSVALLKSSKPADALACIESTDQVFAQAGDPKRQAMALGNQATALEELGRTDDALAKYHQSVDIFKTNRRIRYGRPRPEKNIQHAIPRQRPRRRHVNYGRCLKPAIQTWPAGSHPQVALGHRR